MTLIDRPGAGLPRAPVTVELDDIQATVLRYRPEPYYGTHIMLHVDEALAGREFVRRLTPHVESASGWWKAGRSWISVAISYAGLVALGVPEDSLQSFPEAFRAGMAARAGRLLDYGPNDPGHWDAPFGSGLIHIGGQRLQRLRTGVAPDHGDGAAAVRGIPRRHRADRAGFRRPAG
jgi:deferrochelatase/peroxidase EfeB